MNRRGFIASVLAAAAWCAVPRPQRAVIVASSDGPSIPRDELRRGVRLIGGNGPWTLHDVDGTVLGAWHKTDRGWLFIDRDGDVRDRVGR